MTGQEGLHQDLDDILSDAGNPVFAGWMGNLRSYTFPSGELKFLETEETETGIVGWRWLTGDGVIDIIQHTYAERFARQHNVDRGQLGEIIRIGRREKSQADRQKAKDRSPGNALLRGLGYSERTHPGLF